MSVKFHGQIITLESHKAIKIYVIAALRAYDLLGFIVIITIYYFFGEVARS